MPLTGHNSTNDDIVSQFETARKRSQNFSQIWTELDKSEGKLRRIETNILELEMMGLAVEEEAVEVLVSLLPLEVGTEDLVATPWVLVRLPFASHLYLHPC